MRQDVDLGLELGVRGDRARLADDLAALQVVLFHAAEEDADVVAGLALVERLLEHLDAGDVEVLLAPKPTISTASPTLTRAALDPAGADRAAALDREDVLDRHQERLVDLADRLGDVLVHRLDQVEDRLGGLGVARGSPGPGGCCRG